MNTIEKEIIEATRDFAKRNNVHYDDMTESIILNAIREASKPKAEDVSEILEFFIYFLKTRFSTYKVSRIRAKKAIDLFLMES